VHNGIIENHDELRIELKAKGYAFETQTDTEVIAHLVHSLYRGKLLDAVRQATHRLVGAYAIAVVSKREPHRVVGARAGNPLIVGIGKGENFLASDALALAGTTDRIVYLEEGDVAEATLEGHRIFDAAGKQVQRPAVTVQATGSEAELGPYRHFMQKEIFEQPRAVADTLESVSDMSPALFGDARGAVLAKAKSVLILACGTSYYSGLIAKYWLESVARLPTQVEIASEYRYRDSIPNSGTLVVVVSQSGETLDTLAALRHAKSLGHRKTLAICNVATSALMRETRLKFLTHAGVEIGVASTKAFTTQLVALFLLALTLAKLGRRLGRKDEQKHLKSLRHLPKAIAAALALEPRLMDWAARFAKKEHALFLGRGMHYPVALEGALKLKEISYIHAEAYPAGELKHGPLALVTSEMPVVTVAPNDALLEKLKANMQEVRARGGELYVLADADSKVASSDGVNVLRLPENYGLLSPILHVVPLQLLAYHTALARGTDVDKPRNLAKSVTVE
jgi:glucosamine--fructose-6-phosphate aminotransferase (isomerizing)